jgi:hypothetical protein
LWLRKKIMAYKVNLLLLCRIKMYILLIVKIISLSTV